MYGPVIIKNAMVTFYKKKLVVYWYKSVNRIQISESYTNQWVVYTEYKYIP